MNWLMKSLLKILVIGITVFIAANYITGFQVQSIGPAIFMSFLLAVLNTVVRPILVLITLPITILTLGLFLFVINCALFWLSGNFVDGIVIDGIVPVLIGALLVSIISWVVDMLLDKK